jgi:hypothetical protein
LRLAAPNTRQSFNVWRPRRSPVAPPTTRRGLPGPNIVEMTSKYGDHLRQAWNMPGVVSARCFSPRRSFACPESPRPSRSGWVEPERISSPRPASVRLQSSSARCRPSAGVGPRARGRVERL